MSKQWYPKLGEVSPWKVVRAALICVAVGTLGIRGVEANPLDKATGGDKAVGPAGKSVSPAAMILRRDKAGAPWQTVADQETLNSECLLLGLPGAALESKNGAVGVNFLSNIDGGATHPVKETAIVLHENPDVDLDFTLDRGRIVLTNRKTEGPARIQVRVGTHAGELTLLSPGSAAALELFGRWLPGAKFTKTPGPQDRPFANLNLLIIKGTAQVKLLGTVHALSAPPGPALIEWDSLTGPDASPQRVEKLPEWAAPDAKPSAETERKKELIEKFRKRVAETSLDAAVNELLNSDNPQERVGGIYLLAAMDDLRRLADAWLNTKNPDVWENGVLAMRHWIGRAPGQDVKLYQALTQKGEMPPVQAEIILQLLHSFSAEEKARPELYEMLIDLLENNRLGIRGLAYWHLYRLVPAGRKFGYDPHASEEARQKAVAEWRKLVPQGEMPPKAGNGK
jgi:hypothetical protein